MSSPPAIDDRALDLPNQAKHAGGSIDELAGMTSSSVALVQLWSLLNRSRLVTEVLDCADKQLHWERGVNGVMLSSPNHESAAASASCRATS